MTRRAAALPLLLALAGCVGGEGGRIAYNPENPFDRAMAHGHDAQLAAGIARAAIDDDHAKANSASSAIRRWSTFGIQCDGAARVVRCRYSNLHDFAIKGGPVERNRLDFVADIAVAQKPGETIRVCVTVTPVDTPGIKPMAPTAYCSP